MHLSLIRRSFQENGYRLDRWKSMKTRIPSCGNTTPIVRCRHQATGKELRELGVR